MSSITQWKNDAKAALSLTFDGVYRETCGFSVPALLSLKMRGTYFIVTGAIGGTLETFRMATLQEWRRAALLGMELASHTVTHPRLSSSLKTSLVNSTRIFRKDNAARLKAGELANAVKNLVRSLRYKLGVNVALQNAMNELLISKRSLTKISSRSDILSFAYPHGYYDSHLKRMVEAAGYLSARSTDEGYNIPTSVDFLALKSMVWTTSTSVPVANSWLKTSLSKGTWLIETFHLISEDNPREYVFFTRLRDFTDHLAFAASQNVWIDTQQNIAKYLKEREHSTVRIVRGDKNKMVLTLNSSLRSEIYDQALSLKINIPPSWPAIKITQGDNSQIAFPVLENDEYCICVNAFPNKGEIIAKPTEVTKE